MRTWDDHLRAFALLLLGIHGNSCNGFGVEYTYDLSQPIKPSTTLQIGAENELMLVRACVIVQALFPTTGIGLNLTRSTNGGGMKILAVSAFANEPNS